MLTHQGASWELVAHRFGRTLILDVRLTDMSDYASLQVFVRVLEEGYRVRG